MSTVVPFVRPARFTRPRQLLTDRVTQSIMADFRSFPLPAIEAGIAAANGAIVEGKTMTEALAAGRVAVLRAAAALGHTNARRLAEFEWRREQRVSATLEVIEFVLARRLAGPALDRAIARARRVLEGGGTLQTALIRAYAQEDAS